MIIDRRRVVLALTGAVLATFFGSVRSLDAQQDFSAVQIQATHISGPVYMLVGQGGNIAVSSGADGALMVDDQFAPLADKIRATLREIGQSAAASDLKFLLNTHFHGDHTGGNAEFGADATIIAHSNVRERLSAPANGEAAPAEALPVITFDRSLNVHFNGEQISAIHIPRGHTDGDAVIYFMESNVLHMGDDFFAGRFPYVDLGSGGSVEGLQEGIAAVLGDVPDDVQVIPGHGPLSTKDDLRLYKRMLDETIGAVREQMDAGASLDDIKARGAGADWAEWGSGFISADRWLETIHQSLSGGGDRDDQSDNPDHTHGASETHGDHSHQKSGS